MVGELAVGRPVGGDEVEAELLEQRADHRAGHPVAAVDDDAQRLDRAGVDELQRVGLEVFVDLDLLDGAAAGRVREARGDRAPDVLDAGVAAERDRALADELGARVGLRVVRGRAHEAAVELARADEPVEHLAADLPGVDDGRALGDHPVAVAGGELGRAEAHVAAQADAQLAGRLAAEVRQHPCERAPDRLRGVAVDLVAVQAADVVGLEDLVWNGGCHEAADRRGWVGRSVAGREQLGAVAERDHARVLDRAVERQLAPKRAEISRSTSTSWTSVSG